MSIRGALAIVLLSLLFPATGLGGDNLHVDRGMMNQVLKDVSEKVNKHFHDPNMNGLDWPALTEEARQRIEKASTINDMYAAIYELIERLDDSHTVFIPPPSAEYAEYGFYLKPFSDEVRIYEVEPGSAAQKAGLQAGDTVLELEGHPVDRDSYQRLTAYALGIYGVSPLNLVVKHAGKDPVKLTFKPKIMQMGKIIDRYHRYGQIWQFYTDAQSYAQKHYNFQSVVKEGNVGYIDLRGFPREGEDYLKALAEQVGRANSVVIDLRDNKGGNLGTLLSFAGLFEPSETQMAIYINRNNKRESLKITPSDFKLKSPVFLLVDSTTASAAELLARHLQKEKKAVVIGDRTAGAVTAAWTYIGGSGFVMKYGVEIGIARVEMPDGEVLDKKGVMPDLACVPAPEDMATKRDSCLEKALNLAREAAPLRQVSMK